LRNGKSVLEAKKLGYIVRYVPHKVIADYNATYNVECNGKHIITGASKRLGIPLNEIWISDLWKPYEEFILFHELREIYHRKNGLTPRKAHQKAIEDTPEHWKQNPEFQRMVTEIEKMDAKTAKRRQRALP
jgi:competence protein ComEA